MRNNLSTKIIVIGINHKKAPIDIRERFSLTETEQKLFLSELKNKPFVIEAFVLSTCNRVEIYAHLLVPQGDPYALLELICAIKKVQFSNEWREYFYYYEHEEATRHLLRVAAGLDSLVIGEKQILGQVKSAVAQAQEAALFQSAFNILSNLAIRAGKKAHTETDISYGGSSIGWAAVARAEQILGSLQDRNVLIVGAGKMSELTIAQISGKGVAKIFLMNRTHENALPIAKTYNAQLVPFFDLKNTLSDVDVCICAVNAPHYIIERELIVAAMANRVKKPLVLIDIAVPRNVEPAVAGIPNVILLTVDDLEGVISQTMVKRQAAIAAVEKIIDEKLVDFYSKIERIRQFDEADEIIP